MVKSLPTELSRLVLVCIIREIVAQAYFSFEKLLLPRAPAGQYSRLFLARAPSVSPLTAVSGTYRPLRGSYTLYISQTALNWAASRLSAPRYLYARYNFDPRESVRPPEQQHTSGGALEPSSVESTYASRARPPRDCRLFLWIYNRLILIPSRPLPLNFMQACVHGVSTAPENTTERRYLALASACTRSKFITAKRIKDYQNERKFIMVEKGTNIFIRKISKKNDFNRHFFIFASA